MKKVLGICGIALGLVLIVILIQVTRAAPVAAAPVPVGTDANPVFVEDVDNPARAPFAVRLCISSLTVTCSFPNNFVTRADQRTVIEQVSGQCQGDSTSNGIVVLTSQVAGTTGVETVLPQTTNPTTGFPFIIPATPTRIYPDPGTTVGFLETAGGSAGGGTGLHCDAWVVGYTVRL